MFFAGDILGTLIFGWISDNYGRYWSLLLSNAIIMITGITLPFTNGFVSFTILKFLMGLGAPTFFTAIYMISLKCAILIISYFLIIYIFFNIALEYVPIDKRSMVGNLSLAIGLPLGGCLQPWILKATQDWKIFHHILFSQTLVMIFAAL